MPFIYDKTANEPRRLKAVYSPNECALWVRNALADRTTIIINGDGKAKEIPSRLTLEELLEHTDNLNQNRIGLYEGDTITIKF